MRRLLNEIINCYISILIIKLQTFFQSLDKMPKGAPLKRKREEPAKFPQRKKRKIILEDGTEQKQIPRTQENTRELDETIVAPDDAEVC